MEEYDVIIVGGGPAGSIAAKIISQNNLNVLCIDKAKFPRIKPCGGALPQNIINELPYLEEYADSFVTGVQIFGSDMKTSIKYERTKAKAAFVIRSEFDNKLLLDAKKAGAEIVEGERVVDVELNDKTTVISAQNGNKYVGKIILGADGANSIVAKKVGLNPGWRPDQVALTFSLESYVGEKIMKEFYPEDRCAIFHMGFQNTLGYGWIFPKKAYVNLGFGAVIANTTKIRDFFLSYVNYCEENRLVPPLEDKHFTAALIPMAGPLNKTFAKRVMLLGDAAGFVNPVNGEGIHYAIKSGIIAGEIAKKIIDERDFRLIRFEEYQKRWNDAFGKDLRRYMLYRKIMLKYLNQFLRYANFDETFGRLLVRVSMSIDSPREKMWQLMRRYLGLRIRDIFGRLKIK